MKTASVTVIGNEVLNGSTRDADSPWLCQQIVGRGARVTRVCVIPDEEDDIANEVRAQLARNPELVITAGGLGPTADDMTLRAVAAALGLRLVQDDAALRIVRERYRSLEDAGVVGPAAGDEVDHTTSGATAKLGLYYYFYPNANCTASTCQMQVGYISSANGGSSWSAAQAVAGPFSLSRIASTSQGSMVGDYISCSVVGGNAVALLAVGKAPADGQAFNEAMYTAGRLPVTGGALHAATGPIYGAPGALISTAPTLRTLR